MIRIGITKEFSLEVAPVMMEQLDLIFTRGIHSSFTDTGVYFSIELKPFLLRIFKEPYWETPEPLKYYRWVLVVGQHQTVSHEFDLNQFFQMSSTGKLIIFPYILIKQSLTPSGNAPYVIFNRDGSIDSVCSGKNSTEERVLERIRQMDLLDSGFTWNLYDPLILPF